MKRFFSSGRCINIIIILLVVLLVILFIRKTRSGYASNSAFTITCKFNGPVNYITNVITKARVILRPCMGTACPIAPVKTEDDISGPQAIQSIIPAASQHVTVSQVLNLIGSPEINSYTCDISVTAADITRAGGLTTGSTLQLGVAIELPDGSFGEFAFVSFVYSPTVVNPVVVPVVPAVVPAAVVKPGPPSSLSVVVK